MADPGYDKNYDKAQQMMTKTEKIIADTEKFIQNKYRD